MAIQTRPTDLGLATLGGPLRNIANPTPVTPEAIQGAARPMNFVVVNDGVCARHA